MEKMQEQEKKRMEILPHIFNYILKDEIIQRINCVDKEKVCSIKRNLSFYNSRRKGILLAEKIIGMGEV